MPKKFTHYAAASQAFFDPRDGREKRVVLASRTGRVIALDVEVYNALRGDLVPTLRPGITQQLEDAGLLVDADEDELSAILSENAQAAEDYGILYQVVQPTATCQFGCDYCGQHFRPHQLTSENQELLVASLQKRLELGRFSALEVGWFGGEPLLGLTTMRQLSPRFTSLADRFSARYWSRIVTNGFALTPKVARELVDEHVVRSIEITLDGISEYHDGRRVTRAGNPTFDRIYEQLGALVDNHGSQVNVTLRCNVDSRNHAGITPLLKKLAVDQILPRLHKVYFAPVHSWGNDADAQSASLEQFADWEIQWFLELMTLGYNPGLIPGRVNITCMVQKPEAELVDAYGQLFNCTEVSYVPTYERPITAGAGSDVRATHRNVFSIGDLRNTIPRPNQKPFTSFPSDVGRGVYPCSKCVMLPVCGGGCPKLWEDGKIPCPSSKSNIPQRLLLSYLLSFGSLKGYNRPTGHESQTQLS